MQIILKLISEMNDTWTSLTELAILEEHTTYYFCIIYNVKCYYSLKHLLLHTAHYFTYYLEK